MDGKTPWTPDWELLEGVTLDDDGNMSPATDNIVIVTGATGEWVDWDFTGQIEVRGEGAVANAALCLAAPALADALEALADKVDGETDHSLRPVFDEEMRAARAALSQARGGS